MIPLKNSDAWVIVPAYNEAKHIGAVVKGARAQGFRNIVVVDDGSADGTVEVATRAGATVLHHIVNLHKGASMRTGAEYALLHGAKALVFMDGDGQHDPREIPLFLKELALGNDLVLGARTVATTMPLIRKLGKLLTRFSVKVLYGMTVFDVLSGYRAMTADAYTRIRWTSNDYKVESEMIARAGKAHLKYSQITISTIYHDEYKGVTFIDGIGILWNLLFWRVTL